jgi:hypothetical protein
MKWMLLAAAAIVGYQVLCPPIVGLADQGDFRRVIGKFGYGPEQPATYYGFVTLKYVRDPTARWPDWEQVSSEDLFVGTAVFANRVVSKNGKLDIRVIGLIHALAFLAALAWLLHETRVYRAHKWIWIIFLPITTDVARVVYFNTFYAEPASYIFCLLLLAESIGICTRGTSSARLVRWSVWAILLVLAKPVNAPLALLLGAYAIRLAWRSKVAWAGAIAIFSAGVFCAVTAPTPMKDLNTYNLVFQAVLPESKTPAADAVSLGLDPGLAAWSGTEAWGEKGHYSELAARGIIGKRVTLFSVWRFYIARPARMWRHIRHDLQTATLLRPPLGNFDSSSGNAAGSMSTAFSLWSDFHEHFLVPRAAILFLLLPVPAIVALIRRLYTRTSRLKEESFALLALGCMTSFLTASFGDAWETERHMFTFNVLLDACLICAGAYALSAIRNAYGFMAGLRRRYEQPNEVGV